MVGLAAQSGSTLLSPTARSRFPRRMTSPPGAGRPHRDQAARVSHTGTVGAFRNSPRTRSTGQLSHAATTNGGHDSELVLLAGDPAPSGSGPRPRTVGGRGHLAMHPPADAREHAMRHDIVGRDQRSDVGGGQPPWPGPPPDPQQQAGAAVVGVSQGERPCPVDRGAQPGPPGGGQMRGGVQDQQVGWVDVLDDEPGGVGWPVGDAVADWPGAAAAREPGRWRWASWPGTAAGRPSGRCTSRHGASPSGPAMATPGRAGPGW